MVYVDCYVAAVPTANRERFRAHAEQVSAVFRENGATEYVECWGDDVPEGKLTSFPLAVQRGADETVVVGWCLWPSKEVRDAAWSKMMEDARMPTGDAMPFDGKRMIHGGFERIVHA